MWMLWFFWQVSPVCSGTRDPKETPVQQAIQDSRAPKDPRDSQETLVSVSMKMSLSCHMSQPPPPPNKQKKKTFSCMLELLLDWANLRQAFMMFAWRTQGISRKPWYLSLWEQVLVAMSTIKNFFFCMLELLLDCPNLRQALGLYDVCLKDPRDSQETLVIVSMEN